MNHELRRALIRSREEMAESYQEHLTLRNLSLAVGYSPFHFHREFSALFGQTPAEFVRELRLARAKQLLLRSQLQVAEICQEVGYLSRPTFTREFQRKNGQSPAEFRRIYSMPEMWIVKVVPHCYLPIARNDTRRR